MKKWTGPKTVILIIGLLIVLSACATSREAQVAYEGQRAVPMQTLPLGAGVLVMGLKLEPYAPITPKEPTQLVEVRPTLQPYAPATPK